MKLLVGLGNPGREYEGQRHNVGYMAADEIVRRHSFSPWRSRFSGLLCEGEVAGERCLLLKPTTYMNLSGDSVGQVANFYKILPDSIIAFHDELDLAFAKIKVKLGGGHAGHNGLRSMMAHLPGDFWRVRIGIGHPGDKALVHNHVLGDFSKAERAAIQPLLEALADSLPPLLNGDAAAYATKVALILSPPKPKTEKPKQTKVVGEQDGR